MRGNNVARIGIVSQSVGAVGELWCVGTARVVICYDQIKIAH